MSQVIDLHPGTECDKVVDHLEKLSQGPNNSLYCASFFDANGSIIERHVNWTLTTSFNIRKYFEKDGKDCPDCPLFMYCISSGENVAPNHDVIAAHPCGTCASKDESVGLGQDGGSIAIFISESPESPLYLRLSQEAIDSLNKIDLISRFDACIGTAELSPQIKAYLFTARSAEEQIPYYTFALLQVIDGLLAKEAGVSNE